MKSPLAFAFTFLASAMSAAATTITAQSDISAVTVYTDRAVVTRVATVSPTTAGVVEVSFEKLPAMLVDQSLQVSGAGTVQSTILDVTARPVFVEFTTNDRVKALEDELKTLARQERTLRDRTAILNQQRDYVTKIQTASTTPPKDGTTTAAAGADAWLKMLTFTEDQLGKISAELQGLDGQREELQAKRSALEQQMNQLRGDGGRSFKTVTVRLDASAAGSINLTLRYAVPGASWSPNYDARVLTEDHAVQLAYFGSVHQSTGEDWKNVELTLSTARPALGGAAPVLQPWIVKQFEAVPMPQPAAFGAAMEKSRSRSAIATDITVQTKQFLQDTGSLTANYISAATLSADVDTQATSASFKIPVRASVPTDNSAQKIPITTTRLSTVAEYTATPKLLAGAFLTTKVTNTSEYPLLAGAMNVFLDDTFVAASSVRTVMPGEKFDLALGADEGISVKRKLNNRFTEDTGLVNKGKRITYDLTLTLQNNKKTAVKITLLDQIPVSRHEKIVVKVITPDDKIAKPDAEGILKWSVELNPGEKRDLPLKFTVEYPNDLAVVGME